MDANKTIRLLLVDDHEGFSAAVSRHLRKIQWIEVVGCALNGREAIDMVAALAPDAVLMDMSMPVMDGIEATTLLKKQAHAPLVIITSHYDDDVHRERAMHAGADAFVSKMAYLENVAASLERLAEQLNMKGTGK